MDIEISLVAPCLNEEGNIELLAKRFFSEADRLQVSSQLIIVDDGSSDSTWQIASTVALGWGGRMICCQHPTNLGIPAAWRTGLLESSGSYVALIDSDLQNPPEAVFEMHKIITASDVDLVRGVRRPTQSGNPSRVLMSKALNVILNHTFKMNSRDNKSGFLLGKKDSMRKLLNPKLSYHHYQTFIGVAAHSLGLVSLEIDTPFNPRHSGKSFLSGRTLQTTRQALSDFKNAKIEFQRIEQQKDQL